ncbi:DUF3871 family protein [Hymenobacter sp. DH14]|uniref:DUF3871 family protein n=1 Tax=Hymenobacter cyanobacteriorum TaxID=2926463 RepID=A0A9X1VG78_9BACT|nr:DUF3871 family protein [Hymenobacter cyanobacteriorum]MCI1188025.1 DUF3871 family protein [Hymenobacter cyanobacteriorum]
METSLMRLIHEPAQTHLRVVREADSPESASFVFEEAAPSTSRAFIEANTLAVGFSELRHEHIIPVFAKDNERTLSMADFIQVTSEAVRDVFRGEQILTPQIRVSHVIKGRIPEAKDKPASQLLDWEQTVRFERMMFAIEVPTLFETVGGNTLTLVIGGVKAYNLDNLTGRKCPEHFKVFVGFKNLVCTNLAIRTDGLLGDLRVSSLEQLRQGVLTLLREYDQHRHLRQLEALTRYSLTEHQFAQLIGRCRMYQHLSTAAKQRIPALLYGDQQLGTVVRDYYRDENFCREEDGSINLWKFYNLFTEANKSSYIDTFLPKSINALDFTFQVQDALDGSTAGSWYLS